MSKHVAVVSEMSRLVQEHDLMSVSEVEQDVATQSDKNNQLKVPLNNPSFVTSVPVFRTLSLSFSLAKFVITIASS